MKIRHSVGVCGSLIIATMVGHANAQTSDAPAFKVSAAAAMVDLDTDGARGRLTGDMEDMGPGNEQAVVTYIPETQRLVAVWMMSFARMDYAQNQRQFGPWQLVCKSMQLRADGPPVVVSNSANGKWPFMKTGEGIVALTNNATNRPGNHPSITTNGKHAVITYGTNFDNNGRTYTNVMALDSECRTLVDPLRVSLDSNEDEGAPWISYTGPGPNGESIFTGAYASNNGNDIGVVPFSVALSEGGGLISLTKRWTAVDPITGKGVIYPTNVARPLGVSLDNGKTLICAAWGDNRPPEKGVKCVTMGNDGAVLWSADVAPSEPNKRKYMNQPSLAKLADGRIALNAIESNAMGKGTNIKGVNLNHLYMLEPAGDGFAVKSEVTGLASYQTHAAICSGRMGESGNIGVGVISASPSGVGRPMLMTVSADTLAFRFDRKREWPIGFYGDSGHMANWYGANPMRQGRDFVSCIGDVPNPGFHKQGGFMADVETFFASAIVGRVPGHMKNTVSLSIVPGKQDREAAPENPRLANEVPLGDTEQTLAPPAAPPKEQSGCACSTPRSSAPGFGSLALVGLGLAAFVSRRKRS